MNNTFTISDGSVVTVKKLVLLDFAEVLKRIDALPEKLIGVDSAASIMFQVASVVSTSLPEIVGIIEICTDAKPEVIEQFDLSELMELTALILEVNKYEKIMSFLGQIRGMIGKKPESPAMILSETPVSTPSTTGSTKLPTSSDQSTDGPGTTPSETPTP